MSDTRAALIDTAGSLVRRRGYSAFSYADLADTIGIRKASVHHHFPTKEDLGAALVAAYAAGFADRLSAIAAETRDPLKRLARYAELYREGLARKEGCLCGVLASEIAVLPPRVQAGVRQFFADNLAWLEAVLADGSGLRAGLEPARAARTILSTLQGALFVALSTDDPAAFDEAVEGLLAGLQ